MKKSIVAFLLLFALLIPCVLSGCVAQTGGDVTTPDGEKTGDPTSAADTTTAEPATTPDAPTTTVPSEPVDISTPEGVVLVGRIEKDECYYFVPDRKLNIKYTGMGDTPFVFDGVERLDMFDSDVDGIDKSVFVGKEVTVSGILRFVRSDFEKLYLHAYRIDNGNTAGESHAEPDITVPETEPETKYDPSVPLPEKMKLRVENGRYVYNPYMLPIETLISLGNGFADFYINAIDAILNYRTEIECNDDDYAAMLPMILGNEFPLYGVTFYCEYEGLGSSSVRIVYRADRSEHLARYEELCTCINDYLKVAAPEQSEQIKAEALYHAMCTAVKYDYSAMDSRENIESYYAYVKKSGICVTFAAAYSQLLTQVGIENTVAAGSNNSGEGHAWNLATIDGKKYFCDPTFELGVNDGKGFVYFGNTLSQRESDGFSRDKFHIGKYVTISTDDPGISEKSLEIIPLQ